MNPPGPRRSFLLLALLTLASWALPVWEAAALHRVSLVSLVTAAMFTAMLLAWPFLAGARLEHGRVQRALLCVECQAPSWPAEEALGFCLRCGSVRPPAPSGY